MNDETLDLRLSRAGPQPASTVVPWLLDALEQVGAIHARGLVHHDIHPSRLLLEPTGRAKLLDLGTVVAPGTKPGLVLGTIHHLPPEQLRGAKPTAGADLYALGVVLYEALTGRLPYEGANEMKLVLAIAKGAPTPPSKHQGGVSPALESVILKAIAREPADRFATAADFARALAPFSGDGSRT